MSKIVLILIWLVMALISMWLAGRKDRNQPLWFGLGLVFGLVAIATIILLPPNTHSAQQVSQAENSISSPNSSNR